MLATMSESVDSVLERTVEFIKAIASLLEEAESIANELTNIHDSIQELTEGIGQEEELSDDYINKINELTERFYWVLEVENTETYKDPLFMFYEEVCKNLKLLIKELNNRKKAM